MLMLLLVGSITRFLFYCLWQRNQISGLARRTDKGGDVLTKEIHRVFLNHGKTSVCMAEYLDNILSTWCSLSVNELHMTVFQLNLRCIGKIFTCQKDLGHITHIFNNSYMFEMLVLSECEWQTDHQRGI